MSVILYKKYGDTWQSKKFNSATTNIALSAKSGWYTKPVDPEPEIIEPDPIIDPEPEIEEIKEEPKSKLEILQEKAQALGIKDYEKKHWKTLEKEVKELENDNEN